MGTTINNKPIKDILIEIEMASTSLYEAIELGEPPVFFDADTEQETIEENLKLLKQHFNIN